MCAVIFGPSNAIVDVVSLLQICLTEPSDFRGFGTTQPTPHVETIGSFSEAPADSESLVRTRIDRQQTFDYMDERLAIFAFAGFETG